jgi:hypothetical protein
VTAWRPDLLLVFLRAAVPLVRPALLFFLADLLLAAVAPRLEVLFEFERPLLRPEDAPLALRGPVARPLAPRLRVELLAAWAIPLSRLPITRADAG